MKNATFFKILTCGVAWLMSQGVQAQTSFFEQNRDFRDQVGWPVHRGCPLVADFDNDGSMEVYYGGTSCENGWACRGVLAKRDGSVFSGNLEAIFKNDTVYNKVYSTDTIWTGDPDNPYELKDSVLNGVVVMDTVVTETFLGMKNGLPVSLRGFGSQPLDFNSDGLVDFITLNQGGNNSGRNPGYTLVKNLGGGQFEEVKDEALASFNYTGDDSFVFNEGSQYASLVTGDYDRDGYTDLLITGMGPDGRFVKLFHNVNGERYEDVAVFHPLPFDTEPNRKGLYKETEGTVDAETGVSVPGDYTQEPTLQAKPLSHGSVAFMDFDNDGWLDIVVTGYADGTSDKTSVGVEEGGDEIRFYQNLQNGEFQDVTDKFVASAQAVLETAGLELDANYAVRDVFKAWGMDSGVMIALDYDQDGKMDLLMHGQGNRGSLQSYYMVFNKEAEEFSVNEYPSNLRPAHTIAKLGFICADFNGDDVPDFYQRGCVNDICEDESLPAFGDAYSWSRFFFMSNNGQPGYYDDNWADYWNGECYGARIPENYGDSQTMDCAFGDIDGDGLIDLVSTDWTDKADDVIPSYNRIKDVEIVKPEQPEIVGTEVGDGTITLKWERSEMDNGNTAMFNVYAKSKDGSVTRFLVPANVETGKQLSYPMFGAYATTYTEDYQYYTFGNLPAGEYTVGVQAVNYAYAASEFATTDVEVAQGADGVAQVLSASGMKVSVDGNAITVLSDEPASVKVYSMQGAEVGAGVTGEAITVNGHGVFLVKAAGQVKKIVK